MGTTENLGVTGENTGFFSGPEYGSEPRDNRFLTFLRKGKKRSRAGESQAGVKDTARIPENPDSYRISNISPHSPDESTFLGRRDIEATMRWADDPTVAGHIYRLESTPRRPDLTRRENFFLYYNGSINDQGIGTNPNDSTFFRADNKTGEMLANCRVLWKDVDFVKRPRTAYWERLIVDPKFQGKKIGTAIGLYALDFMFYESTAYSGLPATEVRGSTYVDRLASGAEKGTVGFDRNELFLRNLGFEKHGPIITLGDGRDIQPWRLRLADYEAARPKVVADLGKYQPEQRKFLEDVWQDLRESLAQKDSTYARNFTS